MNPDNTVAELQARLTKHGARWQATQTPQSRLSEEDRRNLFAQKPGFDVADRAEQELSVRDVGAVSATSAAAGASLDWRNKDGKNFVTSVRDQGRTTACIAFSATAALETMVRILADDPERDVELSPAHLHYCYHDGGPRASWLPEKALHAMQNGVAEEAAFPFRDEGALRTDLAADWKLRKTTLTGWVKKSNDDDVRAWLRNRGPVLLTLTAYDDFMSYGSGVFHHVDDGSKPLGKHTVCVVGYDSTERAWIAKNSFGTGWGESGFFRLACDDRTIDSDKFGLEGAEQNKVTFPAETSSGPVCVNRADEAIQVARTDASNRLRLATLHANGLRLIDEVVLDETSRHSPALAYGSNGMTYLAWTGGDGRLNVMASSNGKKWEVRKDTLEERSIAAPALLHANWRLYLAWTGNDHRLNVASTSDGLNWTNKVTLDERSAAAPGLALVGGKLCLAWTGSNLQEQINFIESTDGLNWINKRTLDETCHYGPALLNGEAQLNYAWTGKGSETHSQCEGARDRRRRREEALGRHQLRAPCARALSRQDLHLLEWK
jgi:C1A family cysteine protease